MDFFFRSEVTKLIVRLNEEKKAIKTEGLIVDGKHYRVEFKGNCKQYMVKIKTEKLMAHF